jgi:hypothetical protein
MPPTAWTLIRDLPCAAGSPVMANKVEPPIAVSDGRHDVVADQMINPVTGVIGLIGSP